MYVLLFQRCKIKVKSKVERAFFVAIRVDIDMAAKFPLHQAGFAFCIETICVLGQNGLCFVPKRNAFWAKTRRDLGQNAQTKIAADSYRVAAKGKYQVEVSLRLTAIPLVTPSPLRASTRLAK